MILLGKMQGWGRLTWWRGTGTDDETGDSRGRDSDGDCGNGVGVSRELCCCLVRSRS